MSLIVSVNNPGLDMLCYLRVYTELALRAKGVLMMRENGLDTPVGERTREKFEEMRYLEKSIGKKKPHN